MQILSVERRRLTITLMYGIITAEKELLRSWIFDFLMASSSHRNGLDHSFDHLQSWTTWKQCEREHLKASFLDSKAPKSLVNQEKNRCRFVWDHQAAGLSPVAPTKFGFGKQFPKPFSLPSATQILRGDRSWSPLFPYAFFACFFISAISAFIVFISSASFSSHSSRVLAYTFLDMRLPLTLGVNRPS